MTAVFLKLVNMSIAASWLILVVLFVRLILKKAPKAFHCVLWAIVAIRLICPFTIESALSLVPSADTLPERVITGPTFDIDTGFAAVDNRVNEYLDTNYFEGVTVPANTGADFMDVLTAMWLAGAIVLLIYSAVSYLRIRNRVRTAVRLHDDLWQSENVDSPFILGIIKPKIYLSFNMNEAQQSYVIAHEKAHIARHDHWWKPLGYLLLAIYWFNPLMWIAYRLLCKDIELACDERVIKDMDAHNKKAYSEALLACSVPRSMIMACPLAFGEIGAKERIKSVLNYKKPSFWVIVAAIIICAVLSVCFLTSPKTVTINDIYNTANYSSATIGNITLTDDYDVQYISEILSKAELSKDPISDDRSEARSRENEIILNYDGGNSVSLCFNTNFSEIWIDDSVKPSLTHRVKNYDVIGKYFDTIINNGYASGLATLTSENISDICDELDTDSVNLFDPYIIRDMLFVGCSYDGKLGFVVLKLNDNGKYELIHTDCYNELIDRGPDIWGEYFIRESHDYMVILSNNPDLSTMVWTGDYNKTITVDHCPAMLVIDYMSEYDNQHEYSASYQFYDSNGTILGTTSYPKLHTTDDIAKELIDKARGDSKTGNEWLAAASVSDELAAVLLYRDDLSDHSYSIYRYDDDIFSDYTFVHGGSATSIDEAVRIFKYRDTLALISMNTLNIAEIVCENGEIYTVDPDMPFTLTIPDDGFSVYNADGELINLEQEWWYESTDLNMQYGELN